MRQIYLGRGTELAEHCGAEVLEMEVASPAEALRALMLEHPGARAIIERGSWRLRDGEKWAEGSWDFLTIRPGAPILLVPAAEGASGGVGKIFAGIFLGIFGVLTGGTAFAAFPSISLSATGYLALGAAVALSGVARLLAPTPAANPMDLESAGDRQASIFSTPSTLSQQGEPVPVVLGTARVGALRVSLLIESRLKGPFLSGDTELVAEQTIRVVDLISEGEIEGLAGGKAGIFLSGSPLLSPGGGDSAPNIMYTVSPGDGSAADISGVSSRPVPVKKTVLAGTPASFQITDPAVTSCLLTLLWPALFHATNTQSPTFSSVDFDIEIDANAVGYVPVQAGVSPLALDDYSSPGITWGAASPYSDNPHSLTAHTIVSTDIFFPKFFSLTMPCTFRFRSVAGTYPMPVAGVDGTLFWRTPAGAGTWNEIIMHFDYEGPADPANPFSDYYSSVTFIIPPESLPGGVTEVEIYVDVTGHSGVGGSAGRPTEMYIGAAHSFMTIGLGFIEGRTFNPYPRDVMISDLAQYGSPPYTVRVTRTTADLAAGSLSRDEFNLDGYQELIEETFDWGNTGLIDLHGNSADFTSASPQLEYVVAGVKVPLPDGYDPAAGTFAAPWNGLFQATPLHSDDPAWLLYELLVNTRWGMGIDPDRIDKWSFAAASRRNLEQVEDLVTDGVTERRYTFNGALTRAEDGYKVAAQVAASMDAQLWVSTLGQVFLGQDAPGEITRLFTQANVIDGRFTYEGTSIDARRTVAVTVYRDAAESYEVESVRADRPFGLIRYGENKLETDAPGVTSKGQATRRARHLLISDELESQQVRFQVGLESALTAPGEIIEIADVHRQAMPAGVRLNSSMLILPNLIYLLPNYGDFISLYTPGVSKVRFTTVDGVVVEGTVSNIFFGIMAVTSLSLLSPVPAEGSAIMLTTTTPETWRVLEITDDGEGLYTVLAVQAVQDKWAAIEDPTDIGTEFPFPDEPWPPE